MATSGTAQNNDFMYPIIDEKIDHRASHCYFHVLYCMTFSRPLFPYIVETIAPLYRLLKTNVLLKLVVEEQVVLGPKRSDEAT